MLRPFPRNRRGWLTLVSVSLVFFALLVRWHFLADAQIRVQIGGVPAADPTTSPGKIPTGILPVPGLEDAGLREKLRAVKIYTDSNQLLLAAQTYQNILESLENGTDQDFFQKPDEMDETTTASVRGSIDRWFANMTTEVRRGYELRYAPRARKLLEEAVGGGNVAGLERIYRLYFYTESGRMAAFLLGDHYLDQGHPLRASFCFARLKRSYGAAGFEPTLSFKLAAAQYWAGMDDEAQATLVRLRQDHPRARFSVAGRDVPLFANDAGALAWLGGILGPARTGGGSVLDQVLVFRGNPSRTAVSRGGEPVLVRFAMPTSYNHLLVDKGEGGVIPYLVRQFNQRGVVALPCAHPLVVRDAIIATETGTRRGPVALVRTINSIVALDLGQGQGRRIWGLEQREPRAQVQPVSYQVDPFGQPFATTGAANDGLEQRLWNDAVYGQMSSDGERVYLVQREASGVGEDEMPEEANSRATQVSNVLQALALKSGEGSLLWEINASSEPASSPFAGAYFLGAPLPLGGTLYVLAEFSQKANQASGEVRLLALDARGDAGRGKLLWSQRVATFDDNSADAERFGGFRLPASNSRTLLRRQAGLSPSYADGVLVCPTGLGAAVAIDLTNRSLRWGYKYPVAVTRYTTPMGRLQTGDASQAADLAHWADASVTIAGGAVLLTPPQATELHCVSLADGKKQWTVPRADGLYVAGVHEGNALVVGSRQVRAFKLRTDAPDRAARPAWAALELPEGSVPAGRGFISADDYYLPLSTAEIAVIDLGTGKITRRLKSPEGRPLGNLVCQGNWIISQGAGAVLCFERREPLETDIAGRLKANPDDGDALLLKAKLLLHDGKSEEALALLRRSNEMEPDPHTQGLLVDQLLTRLRSDFPKHRGLLAELGPLVERREHRAEYLRMLAKSHQINNKPLAAFDVFVQLAELPLRDAMLVAVGPDVQHGRNHLVHAALSELHRTSNPDQRTEIDRRVQSRLDRALTAEDPVLLRSFLETFGDHVLAEKAYQEIVLRALTGGGPTALEAQWALSQLQRSSEAATVRWAAAGEGRLLAHAGRTREAAAAYRRLVEDFGDKVCQDGKTGRELFDSLPQDSPIRKLMSAKPPAWGQGKVVAEAAAETNDSEPSYHLPLEGDAAWTRGVTLHFNPRSAQIIARDGYGEPLWDVSLNQGAVAKLQRDGWLNRAVALGHLLVVYAGSEVVALDTLSEGDDPTPRVLWRHELIETIRGMQQDGQFTARFERAPWGMQKRLADDQFAGRPLGRLGPVSSRFVCFQRGDTVIAVHPLTGKTLWQRRGIEPGSYLFGNAEVVAVAQPGAKRGWLLRASDGEQLAHPDLAAAKGIMASFGSKIVVWEDDGNEHAIRLIDATAKEPKTLGRFAAGSKAFVISPQDIAVLQPDGDFAVLHPATGKRTSCKDKAKVSGKLAAVYALRWQDQYIVATNQAAQQQQQVLWAYPSNYSTNDPNRPLITGHVSAFSRTGEAAWANPVAVSGLHFALDQPPDLPLLVFTSSGLDIRQFRRTVSYRVLCVDIRSGRTVYEANRSRPPFVYDLTGDAEQGLVTLQLPDAKVTLKFTDQPVESKPPAKPEPPAKSDPPKQE